MGRFFKNLGWWALGVISPVLAVGVAGGVCVTLVPMGAFFNQGEKDLVGENVADKTLLDLILGYNQYGVGDFPFVKDVLKNIIETNDLEKYVTVDYDKLDGIRFDNMEGLSDILMDAVTVTATLDSLGVIDMLGSFGQMSIINEYEMIDGTVDPTADDFVPNLFYYKTGEGAYAKAFNEDGSYADGVTAATQLYFPALKDVPVLELMDCLLPRFMTAKAKDIIGAVAALPEDGLITTLIGERTLGDLANLDPSELKLADLLGSYETNKSIYDILTSATGKDTYTDVTLGDLMNGIDINAVKLSTVLGDYEANKSVYDILIDATGSASFDDLTIGALSSGMDIGGVKLTTVLGDRVEGNAQLYDLLAKATGSESYTDVTIDSLNHMDLGFVPLSLVISINQDTKQLYDILCDSTGIADPHDITLDDLDSFSTDGVKLANFLDTNSSVFKILCSATGKTAEELELGDLSTLSTGNIALSTVLGDYDESNTLHAMLASATGKEWSAITIDDLSSMDVDSVLLKTVLDPNSSIFKTMVEACNKTEGTLTIGDLSTADLQVIRISSLISSGELGPDFVNLLVEATGCATFNEITVGDLKSFDLGNIHVSKVITNASDTLKTILAQASGKDSFDDVVLSDLQGNAFNTNRIKLTAVIAYDGNEGLYDVLADATGKSKDEITLGDFSTFDMTNIKLSTVMPDANDNKLFAAVLNSNPNLTVGELPSALNNVSVYDAYCTETFTQDYSSRSVDDVYNVKMVNGVKHFVYEATDDGDDSNNWYINKSAGIWLLIGYTFDKDTAIDTTCGRVTDYYPSSNKFTDLEGDAVKKAIDGATIYQLSAAGLIDASGYSPNLTKMTIKQMLDFMASIPTV